MRLPRDLSSRDLVQALARFDYAVSRQTGSHIRLTTLLSGEHHLTIPAHDPLKLGTLNAVLRDVADHHGMTRAELLRQLFG